MWRAAGLYNGFHLLLVDFSDFVFSAGGFPERIHPGDELGRPCSAGKWEGGPGRCGAQMAPPLRLWRPSSAPRFYQGEPVYAAQLRAEVRGIFFLLEMGNGEEKGDFMRVKCLRALIQPKHHRPHSGQCLGVLETIVDQSCLGNRWLSPQPLASSLPSLVSRLRNPPWLHAEESPNSLTGIANHRHSPLPRAPSLGVHWSLQLL